MHKYDSGRTAKEVYEDLHKHHNYSKGEHGFGTEAFYKGYKSMLDVGCGQTGFVKRIRDLHEIPRVAACDISDAAVTWQLKNGIEALQADLGASLPYDDNGFEVVTCFDVLEHLPERDVDQGISELARVARRRLVMTISHIKERPRPWVKEPLHLTIKPLPWWMDRFKQVAGLVPVHHKIYFQKLRRGKPIKRCTVAWVVDL